jgi:hypothetical protein
MPAGVMLPPNLFIMQKRFVSSCSGLMRNRTGLSQTQLHHPTEDPLTHLPAPLPQLSNDNGYYISYYERYSAIGTRIECCILHKFTK